MVVWYEAESVKGLSQIDLPLDPSNTVIDLLFIFFLMLNVAKVMQVMFFIFLWKSGRMIIWPIHTVGSWL
jgi:hypothetical protein